MSNKPREPCSVRSADHIPQSVMDKARGCGWVWLSLPDCSVTLQRCPPSHAEPSHHGATGTMPPSRWRGWLQATRQCKDIIPGLVNKIPQSQSSSTDPLSHPRAQSCFRVDLDCLSLLVYHYNVSTLSCHLRAQSCIRGHMRRPGRHRASRPGRRALRPQSIRASQALACPRAPRPPTRGLGSAATPCRTAPSRTICVRANSLSVRAYCAGLFAA